MTLPAKLSSLLNPATSRRGNGIVRFKAVFAAVVVFFVTSASAIEVDQVATGDLSAGKRFKDCPECPEMIVIPAGQFTMSPKSAYDGRRPGDPEGISKSAPAREVSIDVPFALGVYDVTRDEFDTFVRATRRSTQDGCYVWGGGVWRENRNMSWRNPGFRQSTRDPVVCVNVEDVQAYVQWLNGKLSRVPQNGGSAGGVSYYRLPTWEEEEYAAGGGARTPYYWGASPSREQANYGADRCFPCLPAQHGGDRWLYTSPVGSFPSNGFGLYDMTGNVWQWTASCVARSPSGLTSESFWAGSECAVVAVHGGSWLANPEYLRIGEYGLDARINRNQTVGFRVARTFGGPAPNSPPPVAEDRTVVASAADPTVPSNAGPSATVAPGKAFQDCSECPEMIAVPAGSFIMGSTLAGHNWDVRDVPQHRVSIKAFAASVYDVTRAQYAVFVRESHQAGEKGCDVVDPEARWIPDPMRDWRDPGFHQTDRDPVVCVSWEDAQAYVRWLNSQISGWHRSPDAAGLYRLLSESEWEYAARAGSAARFYWGDEGSHDRANYGLEQCVPCGAVKQGKDRWDYTSPVGAFAPNAFGLYDMLGNVWQWTEDCMHYGYNGAPKDGSAWLDAECKARVLRGGSWLDPARYITVTLRNPWGPRSRNQANGFRVARSLD